jgi:hypothetical protein
MGVILLIHNPNAIKIFSCNSRKKILKMRVLNNKVEEKI